MPGVTRSLHDWLIEEREYARQEERRGRRYAFEALDPRRTALVVVDMVPFFVTANRYCRGIVPKITRLPTPTRPGVTRTTTPPCTPSTGPSVTCARPPTSSA